MNWAILLPLWLIFAYVKSEGGIYSVGKYNWRNSWRAWDKQYKPTVNTQRNQNLQSKYRSNKRVPIIFKPTENTNKSSGGGVNVYECRYNNHPVKHAMFPINEEGDQKYSIQEIFGGPRAADKPSWADNNLKEPNVYSVRWRYYENSAITRPPVYLNCQ